MYTAGSVETCIENVSDVADVDLVNLLPIKRRDRAANPPAIITNFTHNSDFAASVRKLVHEYSDRSQELQKVCSLASVGEVNEDVMEQVLSSVSSLYWYKGTNNDARGVAD
jgi:hypothetical protein